MQLIYTLLEVILVLFGIVIPWMLIGYKIAKDRDQRQAIKRAKEENERQAKLEAELRERRKNFKLVEY